MKSAQDALDNAFEIIKLIKKSPKREAIFKRMKKEFGDTSTGIRSLCPTRWTVKANSIESIIENYTVLIKTFKEDIEETSDKCSCRNSVTPNDMTSVELTAIRI